MKRIDKQLKQQIQIQILSLVKSGITSADQLLEQISKQQKKFESRLFYPALSGLNRSNQLCWHWKYSNDAPPEKHFFLTSEGEKVVTNQMALV